LARSANSVSVQVTEAIGRERVIDAARRAGIDQEFEPLPSLALGAMEMTLEDLTAGYLPFAQGGREVLGHVIDRVETRGGNVLYEFEAIEGFRIIDEGLANQTTVMLADVMTRGTGRRGALPGRQSAGKTGTTNEWRDAWFVGYTPQLTAGVWVGNDRAEPMDEVTGSSVPLDIWSAFMAEAHQGLPAEPLSSGDLAFPDTSRLAGLYAGLRSDLVRAAYAQEDEPGPFGWFSQRVQGRAAPGLDADLSGGL
jgi:penicillin-binding protein 1A